MCIKLAQELEAEACGQSTQRVGGYALIPAVRVEQCIDVEATEVREEHEAEDFAEQLFWLLGGF